MSEPLREQIARALRDARECRHDLDDHSLSGTEDGWWRCDACGVRVTQRSDWPPAAPQGEPEPTQEELLLDDLLRCMEVRNLALEEAALYVQPGPDGQDYLDRRALIHAWIKAAYERHDDGERAASAHIDGGPPPALAQWAAALGEGNTDE